MYRPVLVTAPTTKPVSLQEAKAQLDVEHDDHNTLIEGLIAAATGHLDGWTGILGRCICEQTWRQDFDRFGRCLRLPLDPVISIISVKYLDADGAEQTVQASDYTLLVDDLGPYVRLNDGFSAPAVRPQGPSVSVTYKAGFVDVPAPINHAILMAVSHWYQNREAVVVGSSVQQLPLAFDALVAPFRRIRF